MNILELKSTPRGTLTKAEAIEYVGGPDFFKELEEGHDLKPCRKKATRILYRIEEINRCLEEAEKALNFS